MSKRNPREYDHTYKLGWIIGPTYRDEPDIEFGNPLMLLGHVNATYPDHTQYEIIVTRITKS